MKKSSCIFYVQRSWFDRTSIFSSPNKLETQGKYGKEKDIFRGKNFPCLNQLRIKDNGQDKIKITVEIIEENATVAKYGPYYKGRYYKNTKRKKVKSHKKVAKKHKKAARKTR